MKIYKIFLFFLLIWFQYSLWLGKNGIFDYIKIYRKVILEKKNNDDLDIRNSQIILEIENLNKNIDNKRT